MSGRTKVCGCISKSLKQIVSFKKLYLIYSLGVKVLQGIIPAIDVVLLQIIINTIQEQKSDLHVLALYIIGYIILQEITELISLIYMKYSNDLGMEFSAYINTKLIKKAMDLSLQDFENSETYDVINRAQNQSGNDIIRYIDNILNTVQQIVAVISLGYVLLRFRWQIVIIITIVPVMKSIVIYALDKEAYKIRIQRTSVEREKWYLNFLVMTGNAFKEIRLFGLKEFISQKYNVLQGQIVEEEKQICLKQTITNVGVEVFEGLMSGGILFYIFHLAYMKVILLGDATAYINSVDSIKGYVNSIFNSINTIVDQSMYIQFLYDYLEIPVPKDVNKLNIEEINSIKLKNVSFKYNSTIYGVQDLNLEITSKQIVVIIGENGSGKTTLMKLLMGLYSNYEGEILINGNELSTIDREWYCKQISVVFQDFIKYEASIRENIAYGNIEKINKDQEIKQLVEEIGLVEKTENSCGIDSVLGNWFGESQCSGGEWQRIAIARALFNDAAQIYFFDEPDAALDVIKQKEIYELVKKKSQNKICIYVSHKIGHICKEADAIIILKNGRIEDIGLHDELIQKNAYYKQLYLKSTE